MKFLPDFIDAIDIGSFFYDADAISSPSSCRLIKRENHILEEIVIKFVVSLNHYLVPVLLLSDAQKTITAVWVTERSFFRQYQVDVELNVSHVVLVLLLESWIELTIILISLIQVLKLHDLFVCICYPSFDRFFGSIQIVCVGRDQYKLNHTNIEIEL